MTSPQQQHGNACIWDILDSLLYSERKWGPAVHLYANGDAHIVSVVGEVRAVETETSGKIVQSIISALYAHLTSLCGRSLKLTQLITVIKTQSNTGVKQKQQKEVFTVQTSAADKTTDYKCLNSPVN